MEIMQNVRRTHYSKYCWSLAHDRNRTTRHGTRSTFRSGEKGGGGVTETLTQLRVLWNELVNRATTETEKSIAEFSEALVHHGESSAGVQAMYRELDDETRNLADVAIKLRRAFREKGDQ